MIDLLNYSLLFYVIMEDDLFNDYLVIGGKYLLEIFKEAILLILMNYQNPP